MSGQHNERNLVGSGRVIFAEKASLWIGNAKKPTDFHAHHAIQISLVLSEGMMQLFSSDSNYSHLRCAVISSNSIHKFSATNLVVAQIFIEPESADGRALSKIFGIGIKYFDEMSILPERNKLAEAFSQDASDSELMFIALNIVKSLVSKSKLDVVDIDSRVLEAQSFIRKNIHTDISLEKVASHVYLSPERFRHLFVFQTGIRFRPYVLWVRLCISASLYSAGENITQAAMSGGFSDAAHFTRTFKRMFGLAPIRINIKKN